MPLSQFSAELVTEVEANLEFLRRDLEQIEDPELADDQFATGYEFSSYKFYLESEPAMSGDFEMISSFYRSIEVLQEGHPNLLSADENDLLNAYRTLLESAIGFGEEVIKEVS